MHLVGVSLTPSGIVARRCAIYYCRCRWQIVRGGRWRPEYALTVRAVFEELALAMLSFRQPFDVNTNYSCTLVKWLACFREFGRTAFRQKFRFARAHGKKTAVFALRLQRPFAGVKEKERWEGGNTLYT